MTNRCVTRPRRSSTSETLAVAVPSNHSRTCVWLPFSWTMDRGRASDSPMMKVWVAANPHAGMMLTGSTQAPSACCRSGRLERVARSWLF